jgi:hypothetical protein
MVVCSGELWVERLNNDDGFEGCQQRRPLVSEGAKVGYRGLSGHGTPQRPFATPAYVLGAGNSLRRAVFIHRHGGRDRTFENQNFEVVPEIRTGV